MTELINKRDLIRMFEEMTEAATKVDTEDAIDIYSLLNSITLSVNNVTHQLNMKIWKEYVKYSPDIDEEEYGKRIKESLLKDMGEE